MRNSLEKSKGISQGDIVRVYNGRGECLAAANISEAIRPDVVQLATGAWYDPVRPGQIRSLDGHGNPNVLTLDKGTSRLAQAPSAMTTLVQIELYDEDLPPIKVFRPPPIA